MRLDKLNSELLQYLIDQEVKPGDRLPALTELSNELGVSVGKLREQLELARHLGLVSVRPRLGTRREEFNFHRAVLTSLLFSLATDEASFAQFSQLRQTIEASMWHEAVTQLTVEDKQRLKDILARAWSRLRGDPVHIPNGEHRDLHLTIFSRLDNPFVQGLLQAYWDAYETSQVTRFAEYHYWVTVWTYHQAIVEALCEDDFERGRQVLIEHFDLLPAAILHPELTAGVEAAGNQPGSETGHSQRRISSQSERME
ncbi:MAG: FCD domain-containing protein [Chloroflexi bacterium]|nr:FCD domain-containing protein [Chloroflexota bacterium]MCI0580907.1 FCD domain-containing protein [Chloroflexota bacterium]MCI0649755.1 FCD domain-containing protein [Chloroflexota bacterium]MCI0725494.1 FCD domain-containing protein [Chloroflexota bacterium]